MRIVIPERVVEVEGCLSCPHFCPHDGSMERLCCCGHPEAQSSFETMYVAHRENTFPIGCPLKAKEN